MFVVDLVAASLLTVVLTIGFAAVVRGRGLKGIPSTVWLMAVASWAGGILIVAFGPMATGTHWLPFAITGLALVGLVFALVRLSKFRRSLHRETGAVGDDARAAIALYFFVTLLLFFCAISLRFFLVNFS